MPFEVEKEGEESTTKKKMRAGSVIGIPLTLLQLGVHHYTGVPVDAWTVANNFALANAIYDADRLLPGDPGRGWTRVSAAASTAFYAANEHTLALAPLVPALHAGYADVIKPRLAPIKPFFVASLWTLAIYYVPAWRAGPDAAALEIFTPAALFLSLASLSHAVDVLDVPGDIAEGIATPAVLFGDRDEATRYAFALAFGAALLHSKSASANFVLYDELALLALVGILFQRVEAVGAVGLAFLLGYLRVHDLEAMSLLLLSTDGFHEQAIKLSVDTVRWASTLPEPWMRDVVVDLLFDLIRGGDAMGRGILDIYESVVRDRL